ncbi:MAG: TetR/AcrR family transcriptional regulator [SAR202 cluster bacterium]|nr:TetR/AcrR family transcriptional regulator [SAR202 cluster bacterium]
MQDICKEADLSPGAVYRYFDSKEEIIEASCDACQQQNATVMEKMTQQGGPIEMLDELVRHAFSGLGKEGYEDQLRLNLQWWSEAVRSPHLCDLLKRSTITPWVEALSGIIVTAQQQGRINPVVDPESAGRVLLAMWQGLVLQKAMEPDMDVQKYLTVAKTIYTGTLAKPIRSERGSAIS